MIGDMPPLLPMFLGCCWPRGPFCIPLRMSSSPMLASLDWRGFLVRKPSPDQRCDEQPANAPLVAATFEVSAPASAMDCHPTGDAIARAVVAVIAVRRTAVAGIATRKIAVASIAVG